jgi:chemotaxis protein CheD
MRARDSVAKPPALAGPGAEVYLQPGQMIVSAAPRSVVTILGSCVAACLYDRERGIGGVNHYLLPRGPRSAGAARFGEWAMPDLLEGVLAAGARRRSVEAKLFGGARVFAANTLPRDLGQENVDLALAFLETEKIPVAARSTGGNRGRRLAFQTADAVVWLKCL